MKPARIIALFIFLLAGHTAFSQQLLNKQGRAILPEKGNWSIGIDVVPLFKYAGNLFYNADDSINDLSVTTPFTFYGKKMLADNKAIRMQMRLGFITGRADTLVPKAGSTNPNELVSDEAKRTMTNILLSAGLEKRLGKGRVNGIYGAEAAFFIATDKTKYTYGNELDVTNQSNERVISNKQGNQFGFGLRGFFGVEYFIGAKLSLSAEYGWGPAVVATGRGSQEREVVDGNDTKTNIIETSKSFVFGVDNDMNGGAVALLFYF